MFAKVEEKARFGKLFMSSLYTGQEQCLSKLRKRYVLANSS